MVPGNIEGQMEGRDAVGPWDAVMKQSTEQPLTLFIGIRLTPVSE